ncbi:DUF2827 family protein [Paraburkholderia sp. EG304]|uniref:DUF2827 family protein n=1 Tax=Paraburkholderia sp. EG304 TaxID=3237015 RepID=UPI00397B8DE2
MTLAQTSSRKMGADHATMLHFANSLNLVREHKAVFHGRHHIVVAHRWRNEQNYSFPDALYGDYPLIHNSAWLKDAGYCYPAFEIRQGAAQLQRAVDHHAAQLDGLLIAAAPYHEIWTLPEYEASCAPYFESLFRCPVRLMPHLWSPMVLEREATKLPPHRNFGYRPGRRRWRAGIFEPYICMVKTSYVPLLACETAHCDNPDMLEHVFAYNRFHLKEHVSFNGFARSLDIVHHGLASFEGRFPFRQVVAGDFDVIVSHQWENAQNYVYYEALYGGYPLIHNSHLIGACGYRYDDFDCEEGARALQLAYAEHDADLDAYRRAEHSLSPAAESFIELWYKRIGKPAVL